MTIRGLDKLSDTFYHEMPRKWSSLVNQLVKCDLLLTIIDLANVLKFVDNKLLNVSCVQFWTALESKDSLINSPHFILCPG